MVVAAADDDVRSEALDGESICAGDLLEAGVEVFERGFRGDLQAHDVGEVVLLLLAVEFFAAVDVDVARLRALVDERDVLLEEFGEDGVDGLAVFVGVGRLLPDFDLGQGGVFCEPFFGREGWDRHCGAALDGDFEVRLLVLFDDVGVDERHGWVGADRHEFAVGFGDEHPVTVEEEACFAEACLVDFDSAAGLDGVDAH